MHPRIAIRMGIDMDEKFCLAFDLHWCDGTPLLSANLGPLYLNANLEQSRDEVDWMDHDPEPVPPRPRPRPEPPSA